MKNFIPAIIWAAIIFWLSAGPGVSLPASWWDLFSPDKLGHFIVYMLLTMLLLNGKFRKRKEKWSAKSSYLLATISAGYGLLLEFMQYAFFPGRYFEVLDIIANIIGCYTGLYLYHYFFIKKS